MSLVAYGTKCIPPVRIECYFHSILFEYKKTNKNKKID